MDCTAAGLGRLGWTIIGCDGDKLYKVKVKLRNLETNQIYEVISYAEGAVNSDDYYKENLVLGDLPAGKYYMYLDHPIHERQNRAGDPARSGHFLHLPFQKRL